MYAMVPYVVILSAAKDLRCEASHNYEGEILRSASLHSG